MQLSSPTQPPQRFRFVLLAVIGMTMIAGGAFIHTSPNPALALHLTRAIAALLCALCILARTFHVEASERSAWLWIALSSFVWTIGQLTITVDHHIADFLCLAASLPLLIAVSAAPAVRQSRSLRFFNFIQTILAASLIAFEASSRIVDAAVLAVVVVSVVLRWVAASTWEDQRRMSMLAGFFLVYSPIAALFHPQPNSFLNILHPLPFLLFGLLVLLIPGNRPEDQQDAPIATIKLYLQGLSPTIFPCFVFVLAIPAMGQHFVLSLSMVMLSLLVQGMSSAAVQTTIHAVREELRHQEGRLKSANASLEKLTSIDFLTNLPNRRSLTEALETEHRRAIRDQEWISILMIDIDHFQGANKLHGQAYGDMCLIKVAEALSSEMRRAADMMARYGGEEFVALLPGTDLHGAYIVAENLQRAISRLEIRNEASPFRQTLTISIGVASAHPSVSQPASTLLDAADKALLTAKQQGRNRNSLQEVTTLPDQTQIHPTYLQ